MAKRWRSEDATKVTFKVEAERREVIVPLLMEGSLCPAIVEAAVESALGPRQWRPDWQVTILSIEAVPGVTVAVEVDCPEAVHSSADTECMTRMAWDPEPPTPTAAPKTERTDP